MSTLSTIKHASIRITTAIFAAASVASMTPAVAQSKTATACPVNFFSLDTIWYNNGNKAVVAVSSGATESTSDRPGWTLGDLCQHNETGDIEIFDRKPVSSQAAAVRN